LLVAANVVPTALIFFTLMMEVTGSFETTVLTTVTLRHFQEDGVLHNHRRETLRSYSALTI
jgi:hypothetical protein